MGRVLKLAFVGCGAIADFHLSAIQQSVPEIEITAAIDPDPERASALAKRTGAAVFTSLAQGVAEGDFEAVDLMLPHDIHESVAIEAFEAGLHVLLEKPMAIEVDSCDRILAAAESAGTVFMVGENSQYWHEVVAVQELIASGAIGEIVTARAAVNSPLARNSPFYAGDRPWRFDRKQAGGGISLDVGSHWIRPLRMWLGEIDEVSAAVGHPTKDMEGESLVRALFRFRSGVIATFDAAMIDNAILGPDALFRVTGTKGEIVVESTGAGRVVLYDAEHRRGEQIGEPRGYLASYAPELADFAAAVLEGKPLVAGPEQAIGELRTALAIYRSADSKRWEKVWD